MPVESQQLLCKLLPSLSTSCGSPPTQLLVSSSNHQVCSYQKQAKAHKARVENKFKPMHPCKPWLIILDPVSEEHVRAVKPRLHVDPHIQSRPPSFLAQATKLSEPAMHKQKAAAPPAGTNRRRPMRLRRLGPFPAWMALHRKLASDQKGLQQHMNGDVREHNDQTTIIRRCRQARRQAAQELQ